jgi:hypothetical protein
LSDRARSNTPSLQWSAHSRTFCIRDGIYFLFRILKQRRSVNKKLKLPEISFDLQEIESICI